MGTDKQAPGKPARGKGSKLSTKDAVPTSSYTGRSLDPWMTLSYTERVALGLEPEEVPEGPDHITADDLGRHGGFILRARQIIQAHEQHLDTIATWVARFELERDELDPKAAEQTLHEIVSIYRRALVAVDEAQTMALAEVRFDTLQQFPRERPIDIALRELGELQTSLDDADDTVPEEVGVWAFRGSKLDATSRVRPSGDVADQTQEEGDATVRTLAAANELFAYLGSDFRKAPASAKTVGFSILFDPLRKRAEARFLRHVFMAEYGKGRPSDPGEEALAVLTEAGNAEANAEDNKRFLYTPIKRDRLVEDIRYLHGQLLAPELTIDARLLEAWHVKAGAMRLEPLEKDRSVAIRTTRLRLAWLLSKYDEKPTDYAKTVGAMRQVEDARLYLKQHATGDVEAFTTQTADAFMGVLAGIPTMAGPAVTIDGKTAMTYVEAADWQQNWEKKVAFEMLYQLTVGLGYGLNLAIGFGQGLLAWVLELAGIFEDALDLVKLLWKVQKKLVKALVTGGLGGAITMVVREIMKLISKLPEILEELAKEFLSNWNHREPFTQARYRGKVVGYLAAEIIVAALTAGTSLAARAGSKIGRIVFKILKRGHLGDAKSAAKRLGLGDIVDDLADAAPKHLPDADLPKYGPDVDVPGHTPDVDTPRPAPAIDQPRKQPEVDTPRPPPDVHAPRRPPEVDVDAPKPRPEVASEVDAPDVPKTPEGNLPDPKQPKKRAANKNEKEEKQEKPKKKREGQQLAEELGYPADPGKGYHWAVLEVDGKRIPYVKLSPRRGGNPRPRKRYDPEKKQFEFVSKRWSGYDHSMLGKREPCFPPGTLVKTPAGDRRIEDLAAGEEVLSFDTEHRIVVTATIRAVHTNWTRRLATIEVGGHEIRATRRHPFWSEDRCEWLPARSLWPGMKVRGIDNASICVRSVAVREEFSGTYNLEIDFTHTYFVGEHGVLVHNGNGDDDSLFADMEKKQRRIYRVIQKDVVNGKVVETVIYAGKTDRTLAERYKEHLDEKPSWRQRAAKLRIELEVDGNWTHYDTAVWEKHTIAKYKALNPDLENLGVPISKQKFEKFSEFHMPCP